jgi:hypothetical protein
MPRNDEAAYASNWRTVLLVDSLVGIVAVAAGVVVAVALNGAVGSVLAGAGIAYLLLGLRRGRRWKHLRAGRGH